MSDIEEIGPKGIYAEEVIAFVRLANEYCIWLEALEDDGMTFIRNAVRNLSNVYASVVKIGDVEPLMESGNEKYVTEQMWSGIFQKVSLMLGQHNSYLRIAESDEYDRSDLVTHTISEDLADIYQDLKDFTHQYRIGIEEIMNDAVWEVLDNFDNYWSEKLLQALLALNKLLVKKINPQDENDPMNNASDDSMPAYDNTLFKRHQEENEEDL
ncbi:DUF5063 domain-containing protein [Bacteroidota bacterium]